MSVGGDQIRPESLIKCSGIGDQVTSESLIKCFRNQRSNAAGIGDHFAPEYTAPTISIALTDFKQNAGIVMAFMNTIRLIGPSLLTILTGYLLITNLDALPLGLIGSGIGALFFSWHFSRLTTESRNSDMASKEAVT